MIELGKKNEIFGADLLKPLNLYIRPADMPILGPDEKVICGYDQGLGERMIVCESVAEMQQLYDAYARGGALQIHWYTAPDPDPGVVSVVVPAARYPVCKPIVGDPDRHCERCGNIAQGQLCPAISSEDQRGEESQIVPGFSVAPGTATALSSRNDDRAFYIFSGDLNQMGQIETALKDAGFPVVKTDVFPGFPESGKADFIRALQFVYQRRIEGWWNQQNALIEHGICTNAEFEAALDVQVQKDK